MKQRILSITVNLIYPVIDFFCITFSVLASYKIYRALHIGLGVVYAKTNIIPVSLSASMFTVIIMQAFDGYSKQSSVMNAEEIRRTIKGVTTSYVLLMFILVFGHFSISRYVIALSYALSLASLVSIKSYLYHASSFRRSLNGLTRKHVLIYGAGELGQALYREIVNSPRLAIIPIGFIDDDSTKANAVYYKSGIETSTGISVLGTIDDIGRLKEQFSIEDVYIAISNIDHQALIDILHKVKMQGVNASFVPNLYRFYVHKLKISQIGQIPLVAEEGSNYRFYLHIKRYLDFILSILFLLLSAPLFITIATAIKMDSRGPVFFAQDRVGKDGQLFKMYKFRSMFTWVDPYAVNPLQQKDSRITRLGKFLRKSSLDEIPQIINVLKGDMSLVGPRPEMPFIVKEYNEAHRERLKILPGITGLWQLSGDRKKAIHENMDYDLYYIRNVSLSLDVAILLETLIFAFKGI